MGKNEVLLNQGVGGWPISEPIICAVVTWGEGIVVCPMLGGWEVGKW